MVFPDGGGIAGLVYWLIKSIMGWGWISYGFAIFFFTLFIKLMLSPIDFLNKYLMRRNQVKQQALSAELADLQQLYGNDPLAMAKARQELFRKNGVGGIGTTLMSLVSVIITMVVFFNVLGALNTISKDNIYHEYTELAAVYEQYTTDADGNAIAAENMTDEQKAALHQALNDKYQATRTDFFWIKNIWQPDTPWANAVMSFDEFNNSQPKEHKLAAEQKDTYNAIMANLDGSAKGSNGWLILVILTGLASFASTKLAMLMNKRNMPKTEPKKQPEEIITYSLRDAKRRTNAPEKPPIDPAQMGKMMQYIMPIILILFGLMQTSAFAIYMIASSIVSTLLTVAFTFLVDLIIKKQRPKLEPKKDFDATIINPHAKYFKGGRK